jgi:hypothetical protein
MNAADKTIARIQALGEWIGFVAVTYYGGHILADVLHAIRGGGEWHVEGYVIAGAFAFGVGYYWHRTQERERRAAHGPGKGSAVRRVPQ